MVEECDSLIEGCFFGIKIVRTAEASSRMGARCRCPSTIPDWCWSPIHLLNYCGVLYTFMVVIGLLVANAYFACPQLYGWDQCQGPILFGYVIVFEIASNVFCFHWFRRNNSISYWFPGRLRNDGETSSFTKYCVSCNETVPIRSHHCPLCKYCVLRKDHHCFMVGGCVGFGNQRYFIAFLLWATIGAAYGTTFTYSYLNKFFRPFFPWGWVDYIAPIALKKWLFVQHCSLIDLAMCVLFSGGVASTIGAGLFFISQMFFAVKGTTMYDYSNRHKPGYQAFEPGTVNERLVNLFGPNWALNFLMPQPWSVNRLSPEFRRNLVECYTKDL